MHHYPTARTPSFVVRRVAAPAHVFVPTQRQDGTSLVEVGPRLLLAPIRVFAGRFGGATLYHDAGLVQHHLGDIGLSGFFCNGEIGPIGNDNFLHGYTASLALFVGVEIK